MKYDGKVYYELYCDGGEVFYFDNVETSITMRDGAYGLYDLIDHNSFGKNGLTLDFDGYGNVTLSRYVNNNWEKDIATGTYTALNEQKNIYSVDISIPDGSLDDATKASIEDIGTVRLYSNSRDSIAVMFAADCAGYYVGDDGSTMYLDGYNFECYYIDKYGYRYDGAYYAFDDKYGVFQVIENYEVVMAFPFVYDAKNKTFSRPQNDTAMIGRYVSEDLVQFIIVNDTTIVFGRKDGESLASEAYYFVTSTRNGVKAITYSEGVDAFVSYEISLSSDGQTLAQAVKGSTRKTSYQRVPDGNILFELAAGVNVSFNLTAFAVDPSFGGSSLGKYNTAATLGSSNVKMCQYWDSENKKTTYYIAVMTEIEGVQTAVYFEVNFRYRADSKTIKFANDVTDATTAPDGKTVAAAANSVKVGEDSNATYTLVVYTDGSFELKKAA